MLAYCYTPFWLFVRVDLLLTCQCLVKLVYWKHEMCDLKLLLLNTVFILNLNKNNNNIYGTMCLY